MMKVMFAYDKIKIRTKKLLQNDKEMDKKTLKSFEQGRITFLMQ